jgi:hypothetical protein
LKTRRSSRGSRTCGYDFATVENSHSHVGLVGALAVDEVCEGVDGDAAQPADVVGLDLAFGQQLVEQAASDAELLRGFGDGQQ